MNCAFFKDAMQVPTTKILHRLDTEIAKTYPEIYDTMKEKGVSPVELCDYVTWAYYNAVPLKGDSQRQDDYTQLATETCPQSYYNKITGKRVEVSEQNANLVSSGFLTAVRDYVNLAVSTMESNAPDLPLAFTNYQALNSDVLLAVARTAFADVDAMDTLPASSSVFFEVDKDKTVRGYLNDVEQVPAGCSAGEPCTTDLFVAGLDANIGYADQSALEAKCSGTEELNILN